MPKIPVDNCCGCTACYNICPTSAITMQPNDEGFLYPVVDSSRCCNCNKCEKACPINYPPVLADSFADCAVAQNEDAEVLNESTSGGFIDALCKYIIDERNGYVVGVAYDSSFMPFHMITDSYDTAKSFRNSKYAQSEMGDIFKSVLNLLNDGKLIMFIGTPCQIAGLKSFLKTDYDNLITVDLVCRSIPSPKLWRMYLDWQEERYGSKIKNVSCRKKTYGYHSGALEIVFENGKHYKGSNRVDYYMKSFHKDICSRLSCYDCQFKTKHRCSDFTVFDSWKPHMVTSPPLKDNDRGYSNVIVHSENGRSIMADLKGIALYPTDADRIFSVMGRMVDTSIEYKKERSAFYDELNKNGFYNAVRKYSHVSLKDRVIENVKPFRYFLKRLR